MNAEQSARIVKGSEYFPLLALAGGCVAIAMYGLVSAGPDQPWWVWVLAVLLILAIFRFGTARQVSRSRALRRRFPDAYVQVVALYPLPVRQLLEAASKGLGTTRSLRTNASGVLVLNGRHLEIYGGLFFGTGGRPQQFASVTLPPDVEVTIQKTAQGLYYLNSLSFSSSTSGLRLDLCPIRSYFGLLVTVFRRNELSGECERAAAALNRSDVRSTPR